MDYKQTTQDAEKYLQSIISLAYRKTPYRNREFFCFSICICYKSV